MMSFAQQKVKSPRRVRPDVIAARLTWSQSAVPAVNSDGQIDSLDALLILQFVAGLLDTLDCP